jgi:transcriptional repressor NrdR
MKCLQCQSYDTKVIESREVGEGISTRRRRECEKCQHRFTTYERVEQPQVIIVKNNGNRELFSREKIMKGILRAAEKTPVTSLQLETLVSDIEKQLFGGNETEVSSQVVGGMIMERLAKLNEVAYVRFASVYRRFTDIASFEDELAHMKSLK